MSSTRTMGISVTDVHLAATDGQQLPLGFEFTEAAGPDGEGEKTWIYVYNDSGASIAANLAVMRKAATASYAVLLATTAISPQRIVGISQHVIADVSYGFVLKRGMGTVTGDAAVTAELGMIMDGSTAGNVTHANAVTDVGFGCTNVGTGASGEFKALIDCRG